MKFESFVRFYKGAALLVFNTLLIFIVVNIVIALFTKKEADEVYESRVKRSERGKERAKQNDYFYEDGTIIDEKRFHPFYIDWFDYNACKEVPPKQAYETLEDFDAFLKMGFDYSPWVQYAPPLYLGKWLNVIEDPTGFSHRAGLRPQISSADTVYKVYVLGGSTAFGWSVNDSQTIASYLTNVLSEKLAQYPNKKVEVVNYGRGYYYSTQEVTFFQQLLAAGHRPNFVVFFDGVNTGCTMDIPFHSADLVYDYYDKIMRKDNIADKLDFIPLVRLVNERKKKEVREKYNVVEKFEAPGTDLLINRYKHNAATVKAIAAQYGIGVLYVMQPHYSYYPVHLFKDSALAAASLEKGGNTHRVYSDLKSNGNIIVMDSAFQQFGQDKKALIDNCHYSPGFNKFIATFIAEHIDLTMLTQQPFKLDLGEATGAKYDISKRFQYYRTNGKN